MGLVENVAITAPIYLASMTQMSSGNPILGTDFYLVLIRNE